MGDLSRSLLTGETDPTVRAQNPLDLPEGAPTGTAAAQGISDLLLGRNPDGRLRLSMDAAQAKNPDQQARVLALQARTGLPPDLIERNLDAVERQAARADFDARKFRQESPIVADWLAQNPQYAAVAKDDIDNLTALETFVRGAVAVPRAFAGEVVRTPGAVLSGLGELNEAAAGFLERGIRAVGADPVADFLTETQIPWWLNPTEVLRRPGDVVKGAGEAIKPPEEDRSVSSDIAGGLGQLASQVATAILAPEALAPSLFGMGADIQAERAQEAGATPLEEDTAVVLGAGVTATLERLGIEKLLERVPPAVKNRIYRQVADISIAGGIEAVQEFGEAVLQNVVTALTYNPQQDLIEGAPQEGGTAFAVGGLGRAILNMIVPGRQAQQARLDADRLQRIAETSEASRLRERSPELFERLVRDMAGEDGTRTVYAPVEAWDTLFQDGAIEAARDLLGDEAAYREAKATGGDIAIPVEVYASRIAPTEANAVLLPELRFAPDAMNLREAEEFEARREEIIGETMAALGEHGRPVEDSSGQVYEDVLGQLLGSGVERGAAEKQAVLVQSVFRSLGERTGMDPLALYERYGLEVRREIPEALRPFAEVDTGLDPLLDRLRAGDTPSQTDVFGESLLEMLRSKGGLKDEGGELSARDAHLARGRVGERRLVNNETGMDLDTAAEWAEQLGFIPERDINLLLEAIDEELRGNPVFAERDIDDRLADERRALEQLDEELNRAGIDIDKVGNDTIKAFFRGDIDEDLLEATLNPETLRTLDQPSPLRRLFQGLVDTIAPPPVITGEAFLVDGKPVTANPDTPRGVAIRSLAAPRRFPLDLVLDTFERADQQEFADQVRAAVEELRGRVELRQEADTTLFQGEGPVPTQPLPERQAEPGPPDIAAIERAGEIDLFHVTLAENLPDIMASGEINNARANGNLQGFDAATAGVYGWTSLDRALFEVERAMEMDDSERSDWAIIKFRAPLDRLVADEDAGDGATWQESATDLLSVAVTGGVSLADVETVYADTSETTLNQSGPAFTSALTGAVSALQQPRATADQWAGIIRNLTSKGVKQEEIEFSGVLDWLAEQEGSVAREDLAAFLQANELRVEEVVKGGEGQRTINDAAIAADTERLRAAGLTPEINPDDPSMVAFMEEQEGEIITSDEIEEFIESGEIEGDASLVEAARRIERYIGALDDNANLAKFGTYQLPGGKNYRELLLTLPERTRTMYRVIIDGEVLTDRVATRERAEGLAAAGNGMVEEYQDTGESGGNFQSTHFNEKNVLAHVRFNERTDAEGRRVLFIEEIQSDWHQKGRKEGYRQPPRGLPPVEQMLADTGWSLNEAPAGSPAPWQITFRDGSSLFYQTREDAVSELAREWRQDFGPETVGAVPDAPLKTDWPLFAMKRMIRWAADNGFDRVAWTPGDVQATRYDLSRQIKQVIVSQLDDGSALIKAYDLRDNTVISRTVQSLDEMGDIIGKEAAEKAREQLREQEESGSVMPRADLRGLDLKVGGEGMRGFYDKILPRMVGKYIKRFGAKVEATEVQAGDRTVESWSFAVTPEMREAALSGQALFQDRSGGRGGKRGMIQFDPARQRFRVTLLQRADLSTFLHESGHFYLEVLRDLVERGEADARLQADFRTLLDWMGVADGAAIGTEQHERFARGFEAYLMEGKAPSTALSGVFARFRAWLIGVYRALKNLSVELTDEVRSVFDRLVATDAEIAAAEEAQNYQPLFEDAQAAGMDDAEFEAYRAAIEAARAEAAEDVTRQAMTEITRETRAWWAERRAEVRRTVEAEVNRQPVYMAMFFLQRGALPDGSPLPAGVRPMKLSKQALVDAYGEPFLRRLPRPYVYTREGGVHPDTVAPLFGFRSGDELVQALVNARPRVQVIEAETDERMREQYGDIRTDGSLPEKALAAVHNEKRAQVMVRELRLLHARANVPGRPTTLQVAKAAAARIVGQRRVRDIQPHTYRVAEAKAARAAFDAVAAGDFLAAAEAKRRQLLNHELYRAARDARESVDKAVTYLRGFDKKATRERIGKAGADYLEQIDAILDRFDLSPISNRALDRRQALAAWAEAQEAAGFQVDLPEALLNEARRVSWRELPLEELLGVRDAVRNIEHLAKLKNQLLANKKHRDLEAAVDDIVGAIEQEHGPVGPEPPNFAPGLKDRMGDAFSRFDAAHTKMEFLFRFLDGGEVGPAWEALFQPLAAAESAEQVMMREATERLREIFGAYSRKERALMHLTRIHVPEVGTSFTRASLLAVALNWGNAYNRDVLMRGYGWNEAQVEAVLSRLTAKDWDTVEAIWTFIDGYWPQIEAIQRDLTGLPPEKVEAEPFTVTVGGRPRELRGGYYPIKYDAGLSFRQQQLEERSQTRELYGNNWLRPATRKGHTKERTDSGGKPVLLDLGVLTQHVTNVVHDLTHRRAILDIDRLIQHPRVAAAIEGAAGRAMHRELRPWLQAIANDIREPAGPFERILGHARMGATIVNMGWKITTAIVQPLGYLQSVDVLGERYAWIGLQKFYGRVPYLGQRETVKWVMEQSEMMRNRQRTFDRDVRDALKGMTLSGQAAEVQRSFFYLTGLMDMSVAVPTWLGAYQKAMDGAAENIDAGDRLRAIDYADSIVRTTQSAGGAKDLARIQRGSEYHRIFTMFYSYFSVLYNLFKRRFQITRGINDVPRFAASMFYLWFVPAVMSEMVAGRGPDDEDEWPAWAAGKLIAYPFQTVVGLRDLVNAMGPYGYEASPAFDAFEQTVRAVKAAGEAAFTDEEFEESDARAAALAAGYWAQLPARQMWITGSYLYDWMTGEEDPESFGEVLRGLAFARPPE